MLSSKNGGAEVLCCARSNKTLRQEAHRPASLLAMLLPSQLGRDDLLHVLAAPLVADEAHEPELEAVHGGHVYVLLLRVVRVLARLHPLDPPQRHHHLVRHPSDVARRRGDCEGPVAAEGDLPGGDEEHPGDGPAGGVEVALQRLHQPLALLGREGLPEHPLHAAGLQDPRAQAELPLHRLRQLRPQGHCTHEQERDILVSTLPVFHLECSTRVSGLRTPTHRGL
uniref:Uncharacterized protein n=1 Tax=Triticum urartu TaxID=4572 RepID=A0A8R7VJJ1_TRIUA